MNKSHGHESGPQIACEPRAHLGNALRALASVQISGRSDPTRNECGYLRVDSVLVDSRSADFSIGDEDASRNAATERMS